MPELPEVETVVNIISPLVIGKEIEKIEVYYDRLVQSDLATFKKDLPGKKIISLSRYGKFIFIHLSSDYVLITHLRMEGKFRYAENIAAREKATSALFYFNDGSSLAFDDMRKFGLMYLSKEEEYRELPMIKKLGVEANKVSEKDKKDLYNKFKRKRSIKELLLDQSILAGIGNIYADEILYVSKINPLTKGDELSHEQLDDIFSNAEKILSKAIELGGSTIHTFHPSEGVDGRFQRTLKCYGKEGEECPNCGTKFHKIFLGGRGTTYCPNCQLDTTLKKAIGITGPIGSGKSTVLEHLQALGYTTFSCDNIVHELYKKPEIKAKMSKIIGIDFDIDDKKKRDLARKILIESPSTKQEVENYIYPILENILIDEIRKNGKIAIEVPLLFKAHFEYMFEKIIVLRVDKRKQVENLKSRGVLSPSSNLKLNSDFKVKNATDNLYYVDNDGNVDELFKKVDDILTR
jgi:formamidopyrimidine-DNA glycosylase